MGRVITEASRHGFTPGARQTVFPYPVCSQPPHVERGQGHAAGNGDIDGRPLSYRLRSLAAFKPAAARMSSASAA